MLQIFIKEDALCLSMAKFYRVPLTYVTQTLLFQLLKRVDDVKPIS
jgi:hypothetical protein